ncbi:flagellar biosynthetic protein FliO [Paenibacillus xerothermodurans]|uniref:Flagellar protein n=1 Tax=Paenibacillus xerothermodurans TaxID=1977292 RepID=A0A2W1P3Z5_PAEXE|nr:flagellar biosynthetic protein FliO [Paenibacillus xerothermodurans]PZE22442.1 flagellar protein [Paenibacillus xerothermodurans]
MTRPATNLYAFILVGMFSFAGFSLVCYGEPGAPSDMPHKSAPDLGYAGSVSTVDTAVMITKVIFFLLIIIGLFFVVIKFIAQKNKMLFGRSLRSLGGVPLGQNKSIQVVEIGRSLYIVGVGENVQLMEKIQDAEEVAYITEMLSSGSSVHKAGYHTLTNWFNKLRKRDDEDILEESDITSSFQQVFHNKMQYLSDRKKMVEEIWLDENNKDRLNDKQ